LSRSSEIIERYARIAEEAKEVRRRTANWDFIKSLPPRLRVALEYYIETGDFRGAARIAGMAVDEFLILAKDKAGIYDLTG